jgi:hypothetical protein
MSFWRLALNIVVGFAGLLDLGYIAFYAVGAYTYALLASPHFGLHLPFWVILPIGAMVACFFGVVLGSPTLKLRGDYLAIVTLGFGEIVRIFMNNLNAPINITNGAQGITLIDPVAIGDFKFSNTTQILGVSLSGPQKYYYLLLALALLVIVINLRLQNSRIGRAWQAIREDEIAAKAVGINTRNLKLLAFAMGGELWRCCRWRLLGDAGLCLARELLADRVDHDPGHGGARRYGAYSRRDSRCRVAQYSPRGLALWRRATADGGVRQDADRPGKPAHADFWLGIGLGHALQAGRSMAFSRAQT